MLLDNSIFEEPFESVHLLKREVRPFEELPKGCRENGTNDLFVIPALASPYNALENAIRAPPESDAHDRSPPTTPIPDFTSSKSHSTDFTTPPTSDTWLGLQERLEKTSQTAIPCNTWETFALDSASARRAAPKTDIKTPYLSHISLLHFANIQERYRQTSRHYVPESIIQQSYLMKDLVQLILGSSSNLFQYCPKEKTFAPRIPNIRTNGIGSKGFHSVLESFISFGNKMKALEEIIYANKAHSRSFTTTAFVQCLSDYHVYLQQSLLAMVERLGGYERLTLLQLYYSIDELLYVLDQLITLLSSAGSSMHDTTTNAVDSTTKESPTLLIHGSKLIDLIYSKLESLEATKTESYPHLLKNILSAFLAKSSIPYFTFIHRWLGINPERGNGYGNLDALIYHQDLRNIDPHREFFIQDTIETNPPVSDDRESGTALDVFFSSPHSYNAIRPVGNKYRHHSPELDNSLRPSFISYELAVDILETGKSLRLLRNIFQEDYSSFENYIKDFIDDAEVHQSLPQWKFVVSSNYKDSDNRDAVGVSQEVQSGMNSQDCYIPQATRLCHQGSKHSIEDSLITPNAKRQRSCKVLQNDAISQYLNKSFVLPEMQTPELSPFLELLQSLQIAECSQREDIDTSDYMPPLNIVTFNSIERPLLQLCRSLNASVIAYFFKDLKLLSYVHALRDYFAMGNGNFYTNIVTALFRSDPTNNNPGGLLGPAVTKLGHGRRWPPSSIELSTALNDIFLRSTEGSNFVHNNRAIAGSESPTRFISFCIRDDADDGPKWTNPHSLEAVDFLQLAYSPPYPLNALITPTIIEKYNRVFTYLLKIVRVRTLVQDIQRVMHERSSGSRSHDSVYHSIGPLHFQIIHFLDALHGYVFDAVIAMNWEVYMQKLDQLTTVTTVKRKSESSTATSGNESDSFNVDLDTLKIYNEYFVELLLHQCILKKKQQGILRVIETLLTCALSLSAMLTDFDAVCYHDREPTENEVIKLHRHCSKLADRFHEQMTVLVDLLVALKSRDSGDIRFAIDQRRMSKVQMFTEYHEKALSQDGAVNCYERLLLRLDFNGYYQTVK